MKRVVLIGGTGAARLVPSDAASLPAPGTDFGVPAGPLRQWRLGTTELLFMPRHGPTGAVPPHRVNYRANVQAVHRLRPDAVVGINAVGGIAPAARPARLVIPHQLIDYTWGRAHTYFDGGNSPVRHVEFDPPFDEAIRAGLVAAAMAARLDVLDHATYAVTQGPRLETAAEVDRLAADGCDIVGMTAMPEAGLARELGLRYAICAVVVNRAAGRLAGGLSIHDQLEQFLAEGMSAAKKLIETWIRVLSERG